MSVNVVMESTGSGVFVYLGKESCFLSLPDCVELVNKLVGLGVVSVKKPEPKKVEVESEPVQEEVGLESEPELVEERPEPKPVRPSSDALRKLAQRR